MADISKCSGINCPIRDNCKRYTAESGIWQSWCDHEPTEVDGIIVCDYFIDNRKNN